MGEVHKVLVSGIAIGMRVCVFMFFLRYSSAPEQSEPVLCPQARLGDELMLLHRASVAQNSKHLEKQGMAHSTETPSE